MPKEYTYMQQPAFYDLFSSFNLQLGKKQKFILEFTRNCNEVMEAGAGTGNIALCLADNNKRVTCVEPSPAVLSVLYTKVFSSEKYSKLVSVIPLPMQDVNSKKKYHCILMPNLLQLVTSERERVKILKKAKSLLRNDGKIMVTFFATGSEKLVLKKMDAMKKVGQVVYKRYTSSSPVMSGKNKVTAIKWDFRQQMKNKVINEVSDTFLCRYDSINYIRRLMKGAGFRILNEYSDYARTTFSKEVKSQDIIVTATHL